jgi:hypothetical protein
MFFDVNQIGMQLVAKNGLTGTRKESQLKALR